MISMSQAKSGLTQYLDQEVLPHMSGLQKYGSTVYLALLMDGADDKIRELMHKPMFAMLGVMDDGGNIDADRLRMAALKAFDSTDRLDADIPLIGRITFHRQDVEKLYQLMTR